LVVSSAVEWVLIYRLGRWRRMSWFAVVDVPPAVSVSLTTLPFASNL
jgi:hypothetical protein